MTNAPITPGTHPASVSKVTISIEPHPLSMTAKGGKMIDNITLQTDIISLFFCANIQIFVDLKLHF